MAGAALAIATALFALGAGLIAVFGATAARGSSTAELWRHYGGTALMVAAVLIPAALHPTLFAAVAALAAWRGVHELAALARLDVSPAGSALVAVAAAGAVLLGREPSLLMALTVPLVIGAVPLYALAMRRPPGDAWRWPYVLLFPLGAAAHLALLAQAQSGFAWILLLYGVVETQDSMAFLFGRRFGRRPLAPRLSPRKSVEGAVAGAIAGTAVGVLVAVLLLGQAWAIALALSMLVAAAGFAGDLFASALKRAAGVKDFPPLHPRHGGVLDIYDSTMFAALVLAPLVFVLGRA